MVMEYHFNKNYISQLITKVQFMPEVIQHVQKPYEEQPWYIYRKLFVTDERAVTGNKYWQLHRKTLARAEKIYGVPAAIIVAIISLESDYGHEQGSYPTLNALVTLAFNYPPRADFFQSELVQFLLLAEELKLDPLKLYGSYAGAMGYPQFMPSSYRFYAVDFSNNHKKDLFHSPSDVIGSIANYLKKTGWITNDPITIRATVSEKKYQQILNTELNPKYTVAELKKYDVKPYIKLHNKRHANLIKLKDNQGYEYWLGLNNFYVITNYNASPLYAMAVFQLAEKIKHLHYHHVKKRITTSSGRGNRSSRKIVSTNSAKRS
jgi:membrane-bound lytic murein transglycosylase B